MHKIMRRINWYKENIVIFQKNYVIVYYKLHNIVVFRKAPSKKDRDSGFTRKDDVFEKNVSDKSCRI